MSYALLDTRDWLRSSAVVMGTTAEVFVDGPPTLVPRAFDRMRALEQSWSRFRADSELNRLHERAGQWVPVSHDLFVALRWCRRLHDETEGRFDPSVRDALEAWGYDRTFREIDAAGPAPEQLQAAPGLAGLELRGDDESVRLAPGLRLDLGGIGKGLAADLLVAELLKGGARGACVSMGGDIAAAGDPPADGWMVPLEHPVTDEPFAHHLLRDGALVMSTPVGRQWSRGGRTAHHIIDPRTGAPSHTDVLAVAVAAFSAARAEALAKAAIVAGSQEAAELLDGFGVEAWIITTDETLRVGLDA